MIFRTRNLGSIDYVSGQKKTLELPRDGVLVALLIRCTYRVTNAATGPVGPFFQTLARIIRRADVILQGRDTIVSHSGELLCARAQYEQGVPCDGMDDTVVLTNSAVTDYDVTIPIYFYMPRAGAPLATAADLRKVTQAALELTWAPSDTSEMFTTTNGAAISLVTCRVEGQYLLDVAVDAAFNVRQLSEISQDYAASNTDLAITLDGMTGLLMRSVHVASLVAKIGSNAPLLTNKVRVQTGAFVWHDRDGPQIQADNRAWYEQQTLITGYYALPFTSFGDVSQAINTSPAVIPADLQAIFGVTFTAGTHTLKLGVEAIRPPKFQ